MTTPGDSADRLLLIKKLLNKAEAKGTTEAERESFQAKATKLIMQWGIDEALLADADRVKKEQIIQRTVVTDAPKSYAYEHALIGARVAEGLSCRGILTQVGRNHTGLIIVGFESDVERVVMLYQSLVLQCTLSGATWYKNWLDRCASQWYTPSGTDKFNAKRGFVSGFANGVKEKMALWKRDTVASAAPGTDLVLVDRTKKVDAYIQDEMRITRTRGRSYEASARGAGYRSGMSADLGQGTVGNTGRPAVGR